MELRLGRGSFLFHTDGFTRDEVALLAGVLGSKFGLRCSIRERHAGQYAIYVSSHSRDLFLSLVGPT